MAGRSDEYLLIFSTCYVLFSLNSRYYISIPIASPYIRVSRSRQLQRQARVQGAPQVFLPAGERAIAVDAPLPKANLKATGAGVRHARTERALHRYRRSKLTPCHNAVGWACAGCGAQRFAGMAVARSRRPPANAPDEHGIRRTHAARR